MKALTCEMCGSTNLVKNDGVFVCQSCGTKYSVEEAKKMMVEGTVEIAGTVKIDKSDDLINFYKVARRSRDNNNVEQARQYYDKILAIDSASWEANFYTVYYKSMSCTIGGISVAAKEMAKSIPSVISLVNRSGKNENYKLAVKEISTKLTSLSVGLANGAESHFQAYGSLMDDYAHEFYVNMSSISKIMYTFADQIDKTWGKTVSSMSIQAWKSGIGFQNRYIAWVRDPKSVAREMESYANKIRKYSPSYQLPKLNKRGACYVATAVYGSYDCPEVWTLRRFRDYTLAESWYGRIFIRTYYAISPTLVKWFGDKSWFKNTCKVRLDKLVNRLQGNGVASSPYNDKVW